MIVLPSCGDRLCVAAAHLKLGTQADLDRWDEERLAERFWTRVDRSGTGEACWPWQGYVSPTTGYGVASGRAPAGDGPARLPASAGAGPSLPAGGG